MLAVTIVGSLFAVGFAGSAAAADYKKPSDSQSNWQYASSHVDQDQHVWQGNSNYQKDNYAKSSAKSFYGHAKSGDARAIQSNYQSNSNSQKAWSNAQNFNSQSQKGGHDRTSW
ncbi:hypothetical protein [Haladaptatus sp. R4]|uniref:hypothetical protein n=1 Tax=Haladaptatus sp. R4 TaxID=1679489 RepID=UPI000ACCC88F|nr:hypothetical protein [Haladaptatus sp. R4]